MKFNQYCASSVIALVLAAGYCSADDVDITGAVSANGRPIRGATLLVYEMQGRFFRVPESRIVDVLIADRNGEFQVSLEVIEGSIYLDLVRDICNWRGHSEIVTRDEIAHGEPIHVVISAVLDDCGADCDDR